MKLKNDQKVEAANKVLRFAQELGFIDAFITFEDEDDEFHDNIDAIASNRDPEEEVVVRIHLTLDEDFQFEVNDENEITFYK